MIDHLRRMTPVERLQRASDLRAAALTVSRAGIRCRHPGVSERELKLRLAALWLDTATMRRVFGWDPDVQEE